MIRHSVNNELVINIDGPDGNAFVLLGYAKTMAEAMDKDQKAISEEMKAGDYIHLLKTFMEYFPMVTLETEQKNLLKELS